MEKRTKKIEEQQKQIDALQQHNVLLEQNNIALQQQLKELVGTVSALNKKVEVLAANGNQTNGTVATTTGKR